MEGRYAGLMIHRHRPPAEWQDAVAALPAEHRDSATAYLTGVAACHRALIAMARECGCRSMEEFDQLKQEARRAGAPGARAYVRAGRPETWRDGVDTERKRRYSST